jgi:hypothetical protein
MTPFALAHLSVSWTGLTSLSLNVPAPGLAAAARGADAVLQTAAGQLFASLGSLSPSLRHLSLLLTGAGADSEKAGAAVRVVLECYALVLQAGGMHACEPAQHSYQLDYFCC